LRFGHYTELAYFLFVSSTKAQCDSWKNMFTGMEIVSSFFFFLFIIVDQLQPVHKVI
jgi:hypothetical protein